MKLSRTLPNGLNSGITASYITSDLLWLGHVVTLASNYHPMTRSANVPYQLLALMALPWRRRLALADRWLKTNLYGRHAHAHVIAVVLYTLYRW